MSLDSDLGPSKLQPRSSELEEELNAELVRRIGALSSANEASDTASVRAVVGEALLWVVGAALLWLVCVVLV
jgi:hypothetical protein